jgi:hypothetical protein
MGGTTATWPVGAAGRVLTGAAVPPWRARDAGLRNALAKNLGLRHGKRRVGDAMLDGISGGKCRRSRSKGRDAPGPTRPQ